MRKLFIVGIGAILVLTPTHSDATEVLVCISKLTGLPYGVDGKTNVYVNE